MKGDGLTANMAVTLTATGKQKADNFEGEGIVFNVLGAIAEAGGVATIKEIADNAHISENKALAVVKSLKRNGYVKKAQQTGD